MTPDMIRKNAVAEARRIADECEDESADIPHMAAALMHRAMLEELEPYTRMKARVMATMPTPGYVLRADGLLDRMPAEVPEELKPGLDALDQHIAAITETYRQAIAAELAPFTPAELALMNEAHCHRQALDVNVI